MPVVISCQPVEHGKIRVTFDEGTRCLLYRTEINRFHLTEGTSVSDEDFQNLMEEVLGKRAKKRLLHLLERMNGTEKQLRDKLQAGEYPPACIDAAIDYVKGYPYLADYRYACNFVRYSQEKMSRRQLMMKLGQKGISREHVERALEKEYVGNEEEQIRALLKKRHYVPGEADSGEYRRTYQFLQRRGFQGSDIRRAMENS